MSVDLSPKAVTARLRLVSELRDVCLALASKRSTTEINNASKHSTNAQPGRGAIKEPEADQHY